MKRLAVLLCVSCAHAPEQAQGVPGQLIVGMAAPAEAAAVLEAVALEGYRFEYVAAASPTAHLVKVTSADGAPLDAEATQGLVAKLGARPGIRYVELNAMREPR